MESQSTQDGRPNEAVDDFSQAIAECPSTRVEDFLAETVTTAHIDLRHLICVEINARRQAGETVNEQEYRGRFPDVADEIPDLFDRASQIAGSMPTMTMLPGQASDRPVIATGMTELGDYELLEVIGRGGMGIVYRARQRKLNRIVAVKTIAAGTLASEREIERFRREAEATARLDHPGIVPIIEIGEENEVVFFSMGYVEGQSLAEYLTQNTLTPKVAAEIVKQLAEALQVAHDAGVVHRDLKPGNVLLDGENNPKIVDFGLARMIDREGMTLTGAALGTPSYMSPEQASGSEHTGPITDVYGLGAILYACLCGHPPFRGPSTMATLSMVMTERPTSLQQLRRDVPTDLETICDKCLEKEPTSRYQSAALLAEELDRFLSGRPILARPVPVWTRFTRWCRRNQMVASLSGGVAVALVAGIIVSSYFAVLASQRAKTAEQASEVARQHSNLALQSLRTVIRSVQEKLKTIPEARKVRRELLVQVLSDLERVSNAYIEQAAVDRESAKALADLAQLYTEIGDEGGTNAVQLSETNFHRAVEIYLHLVNESPKDIALKDAAIKTMVEAGDTAREYTRMDEAVWAHGHARDIAMQWRTQMPESIEARVAYLRSTEALGEAMLRSGKREQSRELILEAGDLAAQVCELHPTVEAYADVARCFCTVGDMHSDSHEFDAASIAFETMSAATLKLMELEPDNAQWLNGRSADFERLGDLEKRRKNFEKAREYYEESLRLAQAYVADDPTNLYRLQESTWAYSKLAGICKTLGDTEREKELRTELASVRRTLKGQSQ